MMEEEPVTYTLPNGRVSAYSSDLLKSNYVSKSLFRQFRNHADR